MKVEDFLSSIFPDMKRELVAVDPLLFGKLLRLEDEHAGKLCGLRCQLSDRRNELLRNEEKMCGRLRMNITENENVVILMLDGGRYLLPENFVENRLSGHTRKRYRRTPHRRIDSNFRIIFNIQPMEQLIIVDDDAAHGRVIAEIFERRFKVVTAESGEEALRIIEGLDRIHAMITDLDMPGMNGIELLRKIEAIAAEAKRILMSAQFSHPNFDQSSPEFSVAHTLIPKPIDIHRLRKSL